MNDKFTDLIKNNLKYMLLLIVGVIMIVASSADIDNSGTGNTEKSLKSTLEMVEGVGDVDVMITYDDGVAEGAIIVAEGADNAVIKKMLHDSAAAVLNVPEHKIQVLTKKK